MYDEVASSKAVSKTPEVFMVISEIKDELFGAREKLQPVLKPAEQVKQAGSMGSTALLQGLVSVLEIVKDLNQDIYL
jgi:hypothetical protein